MKYSLVEQELINLGHDPDFRLPNKYRAAPDRLADLIALVAKPLTNNAYWDGHADGYAEGVTEGGNAA